MPVLRESGGPTICATKDLDSESSPPAVLLSAVLSEFTKVLQITVGIDICKKIMFGRWKIIKLKKITHGRQKYSTDPGFF